MPAIRRRFLKVGNRRVHYRQLGDGPPAVLIHSSPADSRLLTKEIRELGKTFSIFAFDTPGFGLSDPLPGEELSVANLADALAETLLELEMPRCPVFGTHTGAAIALELGVRHPERVTGLVLDGVPAFTPGECDRFFREYFRELPVSDLGGQYSEAWTRLRDQEIWFPWCSREPENLNQRDPNPPHSTHLWVQMYFEAADYYAPAYRAASYYGSKALAAVERLALETVFCATETDMLHPHLSRLPKLKPGQEIIDIGASYARRRALIADRFTQWTAEGPSPADRGSIHSSATVERQFVDGSAGPLHLRFAGDLSSPALVLIHDSPGSSEQAEALIEKLSAHFFVVAPDMPGCGESSAFGHDPTLADYASEVDHLLSQLGFDHPIVYGIGFGASVAVELACRQDPPVRLLVVEGLLLPDAAERSQLAAHYAPPIAIQHDGAHWYRTWLMLRDLQVYFPWFDRRVSTLRRTPADFSARPLHRWTLDVMRARETYGMLIQAALADDVSTKLSRVPVPMVHVRNPQTPFAFFDDRLAGARRPDLAIDAQGEHLAEALARAVNDLN